LKPLLVVPSQIVFSNVLLPVVFLGFWLVLAVGLDVLQDLELAALLALLHPRVRDERLPLQLGEVKSRRFVGHLESNALEQFPQGAQARGVEVVEDRYLAALVLLGSYHDELNLHTLLAALRLSGPSLRNAEGVLALGQYVPLTRLLPRNDDLLRCRCRRHR